MTPLPIAALPAEDLLRKRKAIRRDLLGRPRLQDIRIAVLGGATTNEVVDLLELLLLDAGFRPELFQSDYNRFYEDAVLDPANIAAFRPNLVYVHTHVVNLQRFPPVDASEALLAEFVEAETERFRRIWDSLQEVMPGQVIQNNFEHPPFAVLGNLDSAVPAGQTRFVYELNLQLARAAAARRNVLIQDLNRLAASVGLNRWFDWNRWYSYKVLTSPEGSLAIARSLAAMIASAFGKTRKCLILDLDNTLWGGVIGDDGVDKLQLGKETAVGEAFTAFQRYCLALRDRGILLAVCSKNDPAIARSGFDHPDSLLKLEHFSAFYANWAPKHENIEAIARELGLGLDSFVFVDDNPAERAIVAAQLPEVLTPDVGSDVARFPEVLRDTRCFEPVGLSREDLTRAAAYAGNAERTRLESRFSDYGEYLDSLQMTAEIAPFQSVYLERITQLVNKTNQFNLTTRRYTYAEIEAIAADPRHIALYGRLADAFGDNGLISVVIGRREDDVLDLDLWIMSCRVLKREMELAMLDVLVEHAAAAGITRIIGRYSKTPKNALVERHYETLGFSRLCAADDGSSSVWSLSVAGYRPKNRHIQLTVAAAA